MSILRNAATAALALGLVAAFSAPADAGDGRRGYHHRHWGGPPGHWVHPQYGPSYWAPPRFRPPPVYYRPPVYMPPPAMYYPAVPAYPVYPGYGGPRGGVSLGLQIPLY